MVTQTPTGQTGRRRVASVHRRTRTRRTSTSVKLELHTHTHTHTHIKVDMSHRRRTNSPLKNYDICSQYKDVKRNRNSTKTRLESETVTLICQTRRTKLPYGLEIKKKYKHEPETSWETKEHKLYKTNLGP